MVRLDFNNIIVYIACIFFLFVLGKIFILPADNAVRVRTGQTGNEALL